MSQIPSKYVCSSQTVHTEKNHVAQALLQVVVRPRIQSRQAAAARAAAADALQSVTRMNHAEMNLNVLIPGGPAPGSMAARAQAAVINPNGPALPM